MRAQPLLYNTDSKPSEMEGPMILPKKKVVHQVDCVGLPLGLVQIIQVIKAAATGMYVFMIYAVIFGVSDSMASGW